MGDEVVTPQSLFDALNAEFNFDFDCCANEFNTKCQRFSSDIGSAISLEDWSNVKSAFMNPPYSAGNINWCMYHALKLVAKGIVLVTLTRLDPSTKWFQQYVHSTADEVRMLSRRVQFDTMTVNYPFPCCISTFRNLEPKRTEYSIWSW